MENIVDQVKPLLLCFINGAVCSTENDGFSGPIHRRSPQLVQVNVVRVKRVMSVTKKDEGVKWGVSSVMKKDEVEITKLYNTSQKIY
ncbi:hypothetical protein Hdeb2414_s0016g00481891 [Helianthus debilis subsp. tardiflorus]